MWQDRPAWEDEPWDEDQWEAYLRERDRQIDRRVKLFYAFLQKHPRPSDAQPEALAAWKARVRLFLKTKGWALDDPALPFLSRDFFGEEPGTEEGDAQDDPRDTPSWAEEDANFESDSLIGLWQLPLYQEAQALAQRVIAWSDGLPGELKDSTLVHFCAQVMQLPAAVAEGYAFGYERDRIGGHIACMKRGLNAANAALGLLRELRRRPYLKPSAYHRLFEELFEVRNALGLNVQALRERFWLGID